RLRRRRERDPIDRLAGEERTRRRTGSVRRYREDRTSLEGWPRRRGRRGLGGNTDNGYRCDGNASKLHNLTPLLSGVAPWMFSGRFTREPVDRRLHRERSDERLPAIRRDMTCCSAPSTGAALPLHWGPH